MSKTVVYGKDIIIQYNWLQQLFRFTKSSGNLEILTSIYPAELQLNKASACDKEVPFLDLNIKVVDDDIHTSVDFLL